MKYNSHHKATIFNYCIATILAVYILTACNYRDIVDMDSNNAIVSVSVDWSDSMIDNSTMNAFSVWFFPKNGDKPIFTVSNNLKNAEIQVPVGEYSVLVFNETANESDWQSIAFRGTDKYETFEAYARTDITTNKGGYKSATSETVINQIEPLAVWHQDSFIVDDQMVMETKQKHSSNVKTRSSLSIKPLPLTYKLNVRANFTNLNNAYKISGALQGVAQSVFMASGKTGTQTLTQVFTLDNKIWSDQTQINGETSTTVYSFGRAPDTTISNNLQIDVLTFLGERTNPFIFDVTDALKAGLGNYSLNLLIGFPPNSPIELPKYSGEGVSIGDWSNESVIIK